MRLQMTSLHTLKEDKNIIKGKYRVLHAGICRTDAKMWHEGQRDLVLPRVLGHEFVVADEYNKVHAVWPAIVCKTCAYCRAGRENLCKDIAILGFHRDGGFQSHIDLPEDNLFPLPAEIPAYIGTFVEPLGCAMHAVNRMQISTGEKVIVIGGGTQGLLTSLVLASCDARVVVVDKDERKVAKAQRFCAETGIKICKETNEGNFDCAINACASTIAFTLCLTKLRKGGRFSYFSGLTKEQHIVSSILNLVHYKEFDIHGAYGLTRADIPQVLNLIKRFSGVLELLIEKQITPYDAQAYMPAVLNGDVYRIIINIAEGGNADKVKQQTAVEPGKLQKQQLPGVLQTVVNTITAPDAVIFPEIRFAMDNKTKPLGSLGMLEDLALRCALIQQTVRPVITKPWSMVFAADHGIATEGVSAYPSEVTVQMVNNFLNGGAAINSLCKSMGAGLSIIDMGVNGDFYNEPALINRKVRKGSGNFAIENAMSHDEAVSTLLGGVSAFNEIYNKQVMDIIAIGEMGIGNTSSASAITAVVCNLDVVSVTGRGTGIDDEGLSHKQKVLKKALAFHKLDAHDPIDILTQVGGFEIGGMAWAMLAAAASGIPVIIDGFISTAAALIATLLAPESVHYFIAGHKSVECGHQAALTKLGLTPLLDIGMRLGEATGATLAMDMAIKAVNLMRDMATFAEAGISRHK